MKYVGSKRRIVKDILPIILKNRDDDQYYIEPFVGGANVIQHVSGNRVGVDINKYVIALYKSLQQGWQPPTEVTESMYNLHRQYDLGTTQEDLALKGFIGVCCSYGGKWFGGYARGVGRDFVVEAYDNVMRMDLLGIIFVHNNYFGINYPPNSLIYCDPPYADTTKYKDKFNHKDFYDWCRAMAKIGHTIFISEYAMPKDFECVWVGTGQASSLCQDTGHKKSVEKLFKI